MHALQNCLDRIEGAFNHPRMLINWTILIVIIRDG